MALFYFRYKENENNQNGILCFYYKRFNQSTFRMICDKENSYLNWWSKRREKKGEWLDVFVGKQ